MKTTFKISTWLLIFTVAVLSSACLQSESEEINLTLNNDLSGKLTINFKNISSDEGPVAGQQREMSGFYNDLSRTIQDLKETGLKDPNIDLTNKTDLKCDAVLNADFDNIVTVMPVIADVGKSDFEATKTGDTFVLRLRANGIATDSPKLFSIKVAGEVLEHNAQSYDPNTKTLRWTIGESGNATIYLRVKLQS